MTKNIKIEKLQSKKGYVNLERIEGAIDKPFVYLYAITNDAQVSFFIDDLFGVVLTKHGELEFYKDSYSDGAFIKCSAPKMVQGVDIEETMKKTLISAYNNSCLSKDTIVDERYVNKRRKLFGWFY